ncbi:MAG: hypothetical protein SGARI_006093, partial [Bacillariaceae sp.]
DDDTNNVLNVQSNPTPENLEGLKFYAVPAEWFVKAWPILTAAPNFNGGIQNADTIPRDWREHLGRIQNAELVEVSAAERQVSDDENDDNDMDRKPAAIPTTSNGHATNVTNFTQAKERFSQLHRKQQQKLALKMKPGLVFMSDYFLLGPSVWGILKEKFGHDGYEICRSSCKATTPPSNAAVEEGILAVALLPGEGQHATTTISTDDNPSDSTAAASELEIIDIPPEGRFKYESVLPRMVKLANEDDASTGSRDEPRNGNV